MSIRFAQIWLSSPAKPRARGRPGSASTTTAADFARAFDSEDGDRVAQTLGQVHRFGDRRLIHVREAFDRDDQARDAHGGFLNLRREAADRTSGRGPAQHGVQRRSIDSLRQQVERFERHGRIRQRFGDGDVQAMIGEPVGDGLLAFGLLDGRPHAVHSVGQARLANGIDRRELRIAQPGRAECARRPLGILQPVVEQRRAAFDRRGGIVQLVSQSRGQFAEGNHLLVVQVARSEGPGAIDHAVDQDRRDLIALADQLTELVAMDVPGSQWVPARPNRPAGRPSGNMEAGP